MGVEQLRNINVEWCKHGIPADVCSACHPELDRDHRPPARKIVYRLKGESTSDRNRTKDLRLWGVSEQPGGPPDKVMALHLSLNPTQKLLKEILEKHQNLRMIQVSQGRYDQYIALTRAKELLEKRGVKVRIGKWDERGQPHLDMIESWDFHNKREFLLGLNDKQKQQFQRIIDLGFEDETGLTERYFCLTDPEPPRISFVSLSAQYGLEWRRVRKRVMSLLGFLGCPDLSKEESIQNAIAGFKKRVGKAAKAEQDAAIRAKYEEFNPLPQGLRPAHWKNFLELTKIQCQSPERLENLSDKRTLPILYNYYGLGGECHTLEETGSLLDPSITRERVRQLRNKGLIELDILKE